MLEAYPELPSENNELDMGIDITKKNDGAESLVIGAFEKVFKGTIGDIKNCNMKNFDKWDSLNHLFLIMEIETMTGVKIKTEKIADLNSFKTIVKFIGDHK